MEFGESNGDVIERKSVSPVSTSNWQNMSIIGRCMTSEFFSLPLCTYCERDVCRRKIAIFPTGIMDLNIHSMYFRIAIRDFFIGHIYLRQISILKKSKFVKFDIKLIYCILITFLHISA